MKHRVWRNILIDIVLTGLALVVFALFHHVLPRQQESVGIVIPNPYGAVTEDTLTGETREMTLIAAGPTSGIVTDTGKNLLARGGGKQNTRRTQSGSGSSSKGGSALTEETAEIQDESGDTVSLSEKFAEMYSDEIVETGESYQSSDISVSVTKHTTDDGSVTYYVADIYLKDITSFQTIMAGNTYGVGYRDEISNMAQKADALVAVNGDYYGNTNEGVVIRNGVIYRANPTNCDVCVLYYDGTMKVMPGSSFSMEEAIADGAWQAWTFGPALLDGNGQALDTFSSTNRIISANPRTAIGYYEPGHYCLVVVDGRGDSDGMTLPELSQLFEDMGCKAAYNLDGGNSSIMVWNGEVINDPSGGGRASSDAVIIAEVN